MCAHPFLVVVVSST